MGLIAQIQKDIKQITSDSGAFGVAITFQAPNGLIVNVIGLATKHHTGIDTDGLRVNAKNAHCSVSEGVLTDVDYPVRNSNNEVALMGHKVSWTDSSGTLCTYIVHECYPDETIGLLVFILGDYES